ncbi:nucleoside 2-deoxyribosyltransferase [bacterium]|nr:nucleoside 2-deoxyribosyltransferase [bacterium]
MIYLASPMGSTKSFDVHAYSEKKWERNCEIYNKLKDTGYNIFIPQNNQKNNARDTLEHELEQIKNCEFMIILLSDTRGIYLEAGYAYALKKKIYAVKLKETRALSKWIYEWFEYVANDIDELINYIKK